MKTMLKLYAVATLCLIALSSSAVVIGERRLEKPRKKTQISRKSSTPISGLKHYYCKQCDKKFYDARSLNARGYCSVCWCKVHDKAKQLVNGYYICRNCTAEKMRSNGTAKCSICSRTSKEIKLLYQTNGTLFPIEFYCVDHFCYSHNTPFQLFSDRYVCLACKKLDEKAERMRLVYKREELEREYLAACAVVKEAYPERRCEIHKWKAEYAPKFGGDYYTTDAETKYAQNYMKALEMQDKGLLKCMCHDSRYVKYWTECCAKADEAKKKLADFEKKVEELKNK